MNNILPYIQEKFLEVDFLVNFVLHVLILFTFLTFFFMFFICKKSEEAFNNEIESRLNEVVNEQIEILKAENKYDTFVRMKKVYPLDKIIKLLSSKNKAVENYNNGLINITLTVTALLWVGFIITVLLLKYTCASHLHIGEILLESIIVFSFIGLGEYFFFTRIALQYIPVEPSFITKKFIEGLRNLLGNNNDLQETNNLDDLKNILNNYLT